MKLSIITVSRTVSQVNALLRSLERAVASLESEVIVSWNGTDNEIPAITAPSAFSLRVLPNRPYHFAANNNRAARAATGEILAFVNDDVILDDDALAAAVGCFSHPSIGIVGGNLRYPDGRLQHAGVYFDERMSTFHLAKGTRPHGAPSHEYSRFCPAVTGALFLIRRADFVELEFDENFSVAGEDIDLCLRYRLAFDREVYYCAEASAVHAENLTRATTGEVHTPPESIARLRARARLRRGTDYICEPRSLRIAVLGAADDSARLAGATMLQSRLRYSRVCIDEAMPLPDVIYRLSPEIPASDHGLSVDAIRVDMPDQSRIQRETLERVLRADLIVADTDETRWRLLERGCPASRIAVIPYAAAVDVRPRCFAVCDSGNIDEISLVAGLSSSALIRRGLKLQAIFTDAPGLSFAIASADILVTCSHSPFAQTIRAEAAAAGATIVARQPGESAHELHDRLLQAADQKQTHAKGRETIAPEQWAHLHELAFRDALTRRRV